MQAESSDYPIRTCLEDYSATMAVSDDDVRKRVEELVAKSDTSYRALSVILGKQPGYLNDFIKKRSPLRLDMRDAIALATALDVAPHILGVEGVVVDNTQQSVALETKGRVTSVPGERRTGTSDLPILGHVKAGETGFFLDQGTVRGYAMRPESLRDNHEAYAVRVHDESMSNRFEPGWILQVDPWRPVKPGDNVIIVLHDEQAFVKVLVRRTSKIVLCEQFNPRKQVEFKASEVRDLHLVVGVDLIDR